MDVRPLQYFDTLTETPNAVIKLRNVVLSLAVRGKLLPQNPKDVNHALWNEFAEKFARPDAPEKNEPPFVAPESWRWVRLDDVADYAAAYKVDPSEIKNDDWVLDLEEIEKDTSRIVRIAQFAEKQSSSTKAKFLLGDVLYGKLRPYLNKVVVAPQAGFCTTEIVPIRSRGIIEPAYLCIFLRSPDFVGYANSKSYGMKMPRLGTDDAKSAWVAVPPPAEQRRIVTKTEELLALCDELDARQTVARERRTSFVRSALDHLTAAKDEAGFKKHSSFCIQHSELLFDSVPALRQAILSLAVQGNIGTYDKSCWASYKLRDLVALITSGSRGWAEFYADEGPLFVRAQNVKRNGSLSLEEIAHVRLPDRSEGSRTRIKKDDLLVVITGAGVGQATRVKQDLGEAYVSQHVALIRLREPEFAPWLDLHLHAPAGCFGQLQELIYGAKPGLNLENLRELELLVPPLAEQQRIVAKVDELIHWCDVLEARLTAAQNTSMALLDATLHQILAQEAASVKMPSARKCIGAEEYFTQLISALLIAAGGTLTLEKLNAAVALLFLPKILIPLVASIDDAGEVHFKAFNQPINEGSFRSMLRMLTQNRIITFNPNDPTVTLSLSDAEAPPIAQIISKDAEYLVAVLNLVPTQTTRETATQLCPPSLKNELLAIA